MRAWSESPPGWASAAVSAMRFHAVQIGGFQNSPICVWSAVRVEPVAAPSARTSSSAATAFGLSIAGGAGGRNWAARRRTNGRTLGQCVNTGCANAGGVSW